MNKSLQQINRVKINNIIYSLSDDEKTAQVYKCVADIAVIFIPYSIKQDDNEYVVTGISKHAFENLYNLTSIKFAENSEIRSIEKKSIL